MKPHVHFFGGQGIGWALDEDLRCAREAVSGAVVEGSFARSPIIHSAWWPPLLQAGAAALQGKSVVCFADNPPAFYLTRPGFEQAAARVDLWVARSQEAVSQFQELGLAVALAPYTVDPEVFHPLPLTERQKIRADLGLNEGDFVVGNFHRDSLERNVKLPKAQKGPDIFLEIVTEAKKWHPSLKVLLAGPRRHWLRKELEKRNIPFVFSGTVLAEDDFSVNVLPREQLNRLYSALDCVVISSRWEGGPYSVLEALFAGRPVISTRVGMAADLLEGWLFSSPAEGAKLLAHVASAPPDFSAFRDRALHSHSASSLRSALLEAYSEFPQTRESAIRAGRAFFLRGLSRVHVNFRKPLGGQRKIAEIMANVRGRKPGREEVARKAIDIADSEAAVKPS
ncbi:MAG: glycosyltransferase family 4 protein [Terrimicrobiaceae bacterium]